MKPGHLMSGDFSYSPIKWYIFSIKNCSLLLKCIWFSVLHQPHNQTELPFHFMSCVQPNAVAMLFVFLKESGIDWFPRNTIVEMNIYCRRTKKAKRTGSLSFVSKKWKVKVCTQTGFSQKARPGSACLWLLKKQCRHFSGCD